MTSTNRKADFEDTVDTDVQCSCTEHHRHRERSSSHVHEILVSSVDSPFFNWRRKS